MCPAQRLTAQFSSFATGVQGTRNSPWFGPVRMRVCRNEQSLSRGITAWNRPLIQRNDPTRNNDHRPAHRRHHRAPSLFHTVFALCPHVSINRGAPITYHALLARAEQEHNAEAIAELRELGEPPYRNIRQGVEMHAKWVAAFDYLVFGGPERANELFSRWQSIPGYTEADYERAQRGLKFSSRVLFDGAVSVDLFDGVPQLKVPVAVGVGRHDLLNCSEVAASWVEHVRAPQKRVYWFEQSAHFPHFSEPDEFHKAVMTTMQQGRSN